MRTKAPVYDEMEQFKEKVRRKMQRMMAHDEKFVMGFIQKDRILWRICSRVALTNQQILVVQPDLFFDETETYRLDAIEEMDTGLNGARVEVEGPSIDETFYCLVREEGKRFDEELRRLIG